MQMGKGKDKLATAGSGRCMLLRSYLSHGQGGKECLRTEKTEGQGRGVGWLSGQRPCHVSTRT